MTKRSSRPTQWAETRFLTLRFLPQLQTLLQISLSVVRVTALCYPGDLQVSSYRIEIKPTSPSVTRCRSKLSRDVSSHSELPASPRRNPKRYSDSSSSEGPHCILDHSSLDSKSFEMEPLSSPSTGWVETRGHCGGSNAGWCDVESQSSAPYTANSPFRFLQSITSERSPGDVSSGDLAMDSHFSLSHDF